MVFTFERDRIIKKFEMMSDKYHKLSLLFYELSKSIRLESKNMYPKEFRAYIKSLGLDYEKIKNLSLGLSSLTIEDLKKEKKGDK